MSLDHALGLAVAVLLASFLVYALLAKAGLQPKAVEIGGKASAAAAR